MNYCNILLCLFILYIKLITSRAQSVCRKGDHHKCKCDLVDGSGMIDLSSAGLKNGTAVFANLSSRSDGNSQFRYSYNPCYGFNHDGDSGFAALQYQISTSKSFDIGRQENALFGLRGSSNDLLTITYKDRTSSNSPRTTVVTLYCEDREGNYLVVDGEYPPGTYNMELHGPSACPRHSISQLSPGIIILIVFLVIMTLYFFFGSTYNYFYKFKHGINVLPNLRFWTTICTSFKECLCCMTNEEDVTSYQGV